MFFPSESVRHSHYWKGLDFITLWSYLAYLQPGLTDCPWNTHRTFDVFVFTCGRIWLLPTSSGGIKTQSRLIELTDPTGSRAKMGSHVCWDFPDVGYCMLSESISLSLMAAQQPVSVCCFFCLVVVKCRSKHKGEKKIIIFLDTCCEAEQLFVTGGQLLSSLPFLLQTSTDLPF